MLGSPRIYENTSLWLLRCPRDSVGEPVVEVLADIAHLITRISGRGKASTLQRRADRHGAQLTARVGRI